MSHEASEFYKKFLDKYNSGPSTDSGEKQTRRSQSELINAKVRAKILPSQKVSIHVAHFLSTLLTVPHLVFHPYGYLY